MFAESMEPQEILATYIYIQCKRNMNRTNINLQLDPDFVQAAQQGYRDMKTLISKLCEKMKLEPK